MPVLQMSDNATVYLEYQITYYSHILDIEIKGIDGAFVANKDFPWSPNLLNRKGFCLFVNARQCVQIFDGL